MTDEANESTTETPGTEPARHSRVFGGGGRQMGGFGRQMGRDSRQVGARRGISASGNQILFVIALLVAGALSLGLTFIR